MLKLSNKYYILIAVLIIIFIYNSKPHKTLKAISIENAIIKPHLYSKFDGNKHIEILAAKAINKDNILLVDDIECTISDDIRQFDLKGPVGTFDITKNILLMNKGVNITNNQNTIIASNKMIFDIQNNLLKMQDNIKLQLNNIAMKAEILEYNIYTMQLSIKKPIITIQQ